MPVFGGMLAASLIGIFVIPPLYVMFQSLRERFRPGSRPVERTPEVARDATVDATVPGATGPTA